MTEDVVAVFIPIVFLVCVAAVLLGRYKYRLKERIAVQETIRGAIDKGHQLTPDLVAQFGNVQPKDADRRRGFIAISLAIAIAVFSFAVDDGKPEMALLGIAAFPLLIGFAYLLLHRMDARERVRPA